MPLSFKVNLIAVLSEKESDQVNIIHPPKMQVKDLNLHFLFSFVQYNGLVA